VGAELGGHLGQPPGPPQQPVGQVRPQVGEAELGGPCGEAVLGGVAALAGQPLSTWEQRDSDLTQCPLTVRSLTPSSAASRGMLWPSSLRACR
jgi:hypothetical protein